MNLKNEKIKKINRRLLAGTMSFVLLSSSIAIFNFNKAKDKKFFINGVVSYNTIATNDYFIKVENKTTNKEYYTIGVDGKGFIDDENKSKKTYDLFTGEKLDNKTHEIEKLKLVKEYLTEMDMEQDEYTEEESKDILKIFTKNETNGKVKQKVKGK